jgi:nickel transport protein
MSPAAVHPWLALAAVLALGPAVAHEIVHSVSRAPAVIVTLHYPDGSPFAYEDYELYPEGAALPTQVGRTDAAGRVVFVTGDNADWRLKAFSADGHGIDTRFTATAAAATAAPTDAGGPDRDTRLLVGAALLFGVFGLLQLYLRRRGKR